MKLAEILQVDPKHKEGNASELRFEVKWHNLKLAHHTDDISTETKDSNKAQMKARGTPASTLQ